MTTTGFRVLPSELLRAKDKAGIVALSKYVRTLFMMWLNGEVNVTEDDIKKYNPK